MSSRIPIISSIHRLFLPKAYLYFPTFLTPSHTFSAMALAASNSVCPTAAIKDLLSRLKDIQVDGVGDDATARLPIELLVIVGRFLAGEQLFATLAAFNVSCRPVHEETLPILYETLTFRYTMMTRPDYWLAFGSRVKTPAGSEFVK
jgi:hypothetical protein